jgi:RNA polymerase sporulation-specific sigma factor
MEETLVFIEKAHQGDKEARKILVEKNMGLVYTVARRFEGRGCEREDLIQIGSIGLIKAIDKFDTEFQVRFSTYAVPMIVGEIRRHLRDHNSLVKVSRGLKELAAKCFLAREELEKALGREPSLEEIGRQIGVSSEEIVEAMEAAAEVESLQKTIYQGENGQIQLMEHLPCQTRENEAFIDHLTIEQLLKELPEREERLIRLRYFQEKTQTETAGILGISQVQVSRYEKKILGKMRRRMFC